MTDKALLAAATKAAATITAIYEWIDKVEAAGGTTSISGVATCHAFIGSMKKNKSRLNKSVMDPLIEAIEKSKETP